MRHRIRNIKIRIFNILRWIPVIWRDKDWDHTFIYEILRFKLQNQAEYLAKHDRHQCSKRNAEKIMTCVRLIERIKEGYYESEYMDYHYSNLISEPIEGDTELYSLHVEYVWQNHGEFLKKYPNMVRRVLKKQNKSMRSIRGETAKRKLAQEVSRENAKRAKRLLFNIIHDDIDGWWD